MKRFLALPLVLLPCASLAQTADPSEPLPGSPAESIEPSKTKEDLDAFVERQTMRRVQEWYELREAGTFLVPGARFPYQMTFAEGGAEAERLVGLIDAAGEFCFVVLAFERLGTNATRVHCGDRVDPFSAGTPFDVVERGDGVSVYELDDE